MTGDMRCLLCSEQSATFFPEKEAISFKNVVNKKYIIKSELKCKLIMMCFRGPLICYAFSYLEEWS